jgi:hypothetical protein
MSRRELLSRSVAYVLGVLGLGACSVPTPPPTKTVQVQPRSHNWHHDTDPYRAAAPWWTHPWLKDKVFVENMMWGAYGFMDGDGNFYPVFKAMPTTMYPHNDRQAHV